MRYIALALALLLVALPLQAAATVPVETQEATEPMEYIQLRPFMTTPIDSYSVTEGMLMIIMVLLLILVVLKLFWRI